MTLGKTFIVNGDNVAADFDGSMMLATDALTDVEELSTGLKGRSSGASSNLWGFRENGKLAELSLEETNGGILFRYRPRRRGSP